MKTHQCRSAFVDIGVRAFRDNLSINHLYEVNKRVYGQFCIETIHGRHNGIERLVVCLSEYLPLSCVYRT